MNEIKGNVQAALFDVMVGTMLVLTRIASGEFGEVSEETGQAIASALGREMAEVQKRAETGHYALKEESEQQTETRS